ncbi:MAG: alpha/beta fold hydrolase [Solirubrobacteraceae bacterium]
MDRAIEAGAVRLVAQEAGRGIPLVGLHGLTATRRYVLMGSRALERNGHDVVLYDARGHGASSPPPDGDYSYAALAADLEHVLDAYGLARPILVGVSMGAHTAVRFALERPERVAGLVLVTPGYDPAAAGARLDHWDALSDGLRAGGIDGFLAAYDFSQMPQAWRATVETVIRQRLALHADLAAVADALAAVPRSRPFERFDELGVIAVPALVVASRDEADPEHPLATAQAWASALGNAELIVEDEGRPPIAWQGGQLSAAIAGLSSP